MKTTITILIYLLLTGCVAAYGAPSADQSFSGVGVELKAVGDSFVVGNVLPGSAAQKASLPVGSTIVAIDGKPVKGMAMQGLVDLLRGPEGTEVTLTVAQELGLTKTYRLTRAQMKLVTPENFPGVWCLQDSPSVEVIVERVSDSQFRIRSPQQHWTGMGMVGNGCFKGIYQMQDSPEVLKDFRGAVSFIRIDFRVGDTLLLRSRFNFYDNGDKMVERALLRKASK